MSVQVMRPSAVAAHGLESIGEGRMMAHGGVAAGAPQSLSGGYDDVPIVAVASEQKALKLEDVIFVRSVQPSPGNCHSVFMVCDGHQGPNAAAHCVEHMPGLLGQLLPQQLPDWNDIRAVVEFAEQVRRAVSTAAVLLDNDFTRNDGNAGTTLTLCVVSGWLLTVANTGDSNAIVDTGDVVSEITYSHRIQVNKAEQARLRANGVQLAPLGFHLQGPAKPQEMGVGPLRMWPGGLCVSRSIGDLDAGPLIVPLPHVRQVLLSRRRALRLIMASDGLWDLVSFSKAAKSVRHKLPHQAVSTLVQMVARDKRMADDVSIIIVDVLPPPAPGVAPQQFPASALSGGTIATVSDSSNSSNSSAGSGGSRGRSGGGGLFSCFGKPAVADDMAEPAPRQAPGASAVASSAALSPSGPLGRPWNGLEFLADVDCFEAYPVHKESLARSSVTPARPGATPKGDFTVHGGQAHKFSQDTSWHTGESQHGANNLPTFLTQAQLEALQANGPAAAASMTLGGGGGAPTAAPFPNRSASSGTSAAAAATAAAAAAAANNRAGLRPSHGGVHASMDVCETEVARLMGTGGGGAAAAPAAPGDPAEQQQRGGEGYNRMRAVPSHLQPSQHYNRMASNSVAPPPAGGADGPAGRAGSSPVPAAARSPASPAPGALMRSASAEFETDGNAVYVAPHEEGGRRLAPGRVVGVTPAAAAASHFGSAPVAQLTGSGGRGSAGNPGSLSAAAAAADDEEAGLRMLGVRCALSAGDDGSDGGASSPQYAQRGDGI